jgi:hypothetical protein
MKIVEQMRRKSVVLGIYSRRIDRFRDHAGPRSYDGATTACERAAPEHRPGTLSTPGQSFQSTSLTSLMSPERRRVAAVPPEPSAANRLPD